MFFFAGDVNVRLKSRKRTRNPLEWKTAIQKQKVQSGQEHVTKAGRTIAAKTFKSQIICRCHLNCHEKIDVVIQKSIFDKYYGVQSWSSKTQLLRSFIQRSQAKENIDPKINLKPRDHISKYFLKDEKGNQKQVCSSFLTKILQISRVTLFRAGQSTEINPQALERRGLYPTRRTDTRSIQDVKNFIGKFPTFESHRIYKYLHPRLTIKKMYKIYVNESNLNGKKPLSVHIFRRIFKKDFMLRFVRRRKRCNTCKRLDKDANSMVLSEKKKKKLLKKKKEHINEGRKVKKNLVYCVQEATNSFDRNEVFTFALQKLAVPFVAEIGLLKFRPLWCYNLCIYDEVRKRAYIYAWNESVAPCGSREIGSCLYRHAKSIITENKNKVIFYCDPHSGQMRNIKISMMLQYFLQFNLDPEIKQMEQRFVLAGHSNGSCNRIFSHINKAIKESESIYSPQHFVDVMSSISERNPNFAIVNMKRENFFDIKEMEQLAVKMNEKENTIWQNTQSIIHTLDGPIILNVKRSGDSETSIVKAVLPDEFTDISLLTFDESSNEISKSKYDDLIKSLEFIPDQHHHEFYKALKHSTSFELDYGLASKLTDDENMSD